MSSHRSRAAAAERHFLIHLINDSAALASPPVPPIPAGHAHEIPLEALTAFERTSFFGSFFQDTQPGGAL